MSSARGPEAWAKWRRVMVEQRRSGQNIAAFCRERGLPVGQFFAWRKRLSQAAPTDTFVEVQLVETEAALSPIAPIEVLLAGGARLLVAPGFDPAHLRAVVAALESRA